MLPLQVRLGRTINVAFLLLLVLVSTTEALDRKNTKSSKLLKNFRKKKKISLKNVFLLCGIHEINYNKFQIYFFFFVHGFKKLLVTMS